MKLTSEIKQRIAQNCSLYNERSYYPDKVLLQLEQSCNNCQNFVRGHCTKEVLDDIYTNIRLN